MKKFIKVVSCGLLIFAVMFVGIAAFAAKSPEVKEEDFLPEISNVYIVDNDKRVVCTIPIESLKLTSVYGIDNLDEADAEIFKQCYDEALKEKNLVKYFFWMDLDGLYMPSENGYVCVEFIVPGITQESKVIVKVNGNDLGEDNTYFGTDTVTVYMRTFGAVSIYEERGAVK